MLCCLIKSDWVNPNRRWSVIAHSLTVTKKTVIGFFILLPRFLVRVSTTAIDDHNSILLERKISAIVPTSVFLPIILYFLQGRFQRLSNFSILCPLLYTPHIRKGFNSCASFSVFGHILSRSQSTKVSTNTQISTRFIHSLILLTAKVSRLPMT